MGHLPDSEGTPGFRGPRLPSQPWPLWSWGPLCWAGGQAGGPSGTAWRKPGLLWGGGGRRDSDQEPHLRPGGPSPAPGRVDGAGELSPQDQLGPRLARVGYWGAEGGVAAVTLGPPQPSSGRAWSSEPPAPWAPAAPGPDPLNPANPWTFAVTRAAVRAPGPGRGTLQLRRARGRRSRTQGETIAGGETEAQNYVQRP